VAFTIIRQEVKGEKKYGIQTTGADELKKLERTGIDISHATIYMPVSYTLLESVLEQTAPSGNKHFVDIGCGKGRALCVAAHYGFNTLTGVDLSPDFCRDATANLLLTQQKFPSIHFTIAAQDAAAWPIPKDADCIFLFNPFDEKLMEKVVRNIDLSLTAYPRNLQVIYANPLYKKLFTDKQFAEVYHSKTGRLFEVSVLNRQC
jgi:SAM-dependent methyltransferase